MKKRTMSILLATVMLMGVVAGCGNDAADTTDAEQTEIGSEAEVAVDAVDEEMSNTEELEDETEDSQESEWEIPEVTMAAETIPDNEALAFVKDMRLGWNLGNTLDAIQDNAKDEMAIETSWQSVKTSQELIDAMKDAGFNTIRVPVSWHNHVTDDNYTISVEWLNRVQEVVDYAYNQGMYVILNIHHDNSTDFLYPDSDHLEQSKTYVSAIWQQLAERFALYDSHLIFESMNEPRLVGTTYEWWIDNNNAQCQDAIACINELNQLVVDTIRATGGLNADRYLMVPGYAASIDGATNSGFVLPTDSADNKLIVSVHAYTPYNFALQAEADSGSVSTFDASSTSSTRDIDSLMDRIYNTYVSNGIPVVIGEFGARDKSQNTQDRIDFATYYIAAARAHGVTCCWWDNNAFSGNGENFGLYYRLGGYFVYPELVDALNKYAD